MSTPPLRVRNEPLVALPLLLRPTPLVSITAAPASLPASAGSCTQSSASVCIACPHATPAHQMHLALSRHAQLPFRTLHLLPTADTQFDALGKYGIDLTAKAAELDPVIGRDEEIRWDSPQGWR